MLSFSFPPDTFVDPDAAQALSYSASNLPPGLIFDGPTQTFGGTPTQAGVFFVTVSATDNGGPSLSTNTTFAFVIAPAPLTITTHNATRFRGQSNPAFTGSLVGLMNGDFITAAFTCDATELSPAGDYPVAVQLQDPDGRLENYSVTTNLGTLAVTCPANLAVTSTADSGPGSLREAITLANLSCVPGAVSITFQIPGAGLQTIAPLTELPAITRAVTIDGYSQPGSSPNMQAVSVDAVLLVQLTGTNLSGRGLVLETGAGNSVIRGLIVNRFAYGISLDSVDGCGIEGNFVGTDATGTNAQPNDVGIVASGGTGLRIGGTTLAARNVVAGNSARNIWFDRGTGHQVLGNYLGIGADGATLLSGAGLYLSGVSSGHQVGGIIPEARNVISACYDLGEGGTNTYQGNFIGVDATGSRALPIADALTLVTPGNAIGGTHAGARNVIYGRDGVALSLGSHNVVAGNLIGTDVTGRIALGSRTGGGVLITGSDNLIGGTVSSARNVIASSSFGVYIVAANSTNNLVQGNFIGTDITGTNGLGNGTGLTVNGAGHLIGGTVEGAGNLISGGATGVWLGGHDNVVAGNLIGTDVTGRRALGNVDEGILCQGGISNVIGGTVPAARNVIAANGGSGLYLYGDWTTANRVQGNFIGTDITGTNALGNAIGIRSYGSPANLIGGPNLAERNVISGNIYQGIALTEASASNNIVQGNFIGLDVTGRVPLPNAQGLYVTSAGNRIGGTAAGAGNQIAGNTGVGVGLAGDNNALLGNQISGNGTAGVHVEGTYNALLGNQIFDNGALGIDLVGNGVTANDADDPDDGPNHLQNSPELTIVALAAGNLTVIYRVDSAPGNSAYPLTVEFFLADSATSGEGRTLIHRHTYTTPQALTKITVAPLAPLNEGDLLVATATDADGNTSEFSAPAAVTVNHAPSLQTPVPDQNAIYGSAFHYSLSAATFTDPDPGDALSYSAAGLPPGIQFVPETSSFTGTATSAGTYAVTLTATDSGLPPLSTVDVFEFVVAKAMLVVTSDDKSRLPGLPNPPLTGLLTGVTNNDNFTVTFETTATPASAPGNYPITPLLGDPANRLIHYHVTTNAGTFTVLAEVSAPILNGTTLATGEFRITFTNTPGASFTVLVTTNVVRPLVDWIELGPAMEVSPGAFQFTDPQADRSQRFYRVRFP